MLNWVFTETLNSCGRMENPENRLPAPVQDDQPDIVVLHEVGRKAVVMAVTVSNRSGVWKKQEEKREKSQDLGACRQRCSPGDRSTWGCDPSSWRSGSSSALTRRNNVHTHALSVCMEDCAFGEPNEARSI